MTFLRKPFLLGFLVSLVFSPTVVAQTDSETALQNGRAAFEQQRFADSVEYLNTASQTDRENPDIYLLLGRAHYQLGDVDAAMKAWNRTLELAPAQAFARRMIDALSGKVVDVDERIDIVQSLIRQRLPRYVPNEIQVLKRKTLSDAQRVRLLVLEAEALIAAGQGAAALRPLGELVVRDPEMAGTAKAQLLLGQAKLSVPDSVIEGLAILAEVKTDFPDSAEGQAADLAGIIYRVDRDGGAIDDLLVWVDANPDHPQLPDARIAIVSATTNLLQLGLRQPPAKRSDGLSLLDGQILKAAEYAVTANGEVKAVRNLSQQLSDYIQNRFVPIGNYEVAEMMLERILKWDLPQESRNTFNTSLTYTRDSAASLELAEIWQGLEHGDTAPAVLIRWMEENPKHPGYEGARGYLIAGYLAITRRQGTPRADAELSESDNAAIALVSERFREVEKFEEKTALILGLREHWKTYYGAAGAYAAAISGQQATLKLPLPKPLRRDVLSDLIEAQTAIAMNRLESAVAAGTVKAGPLPADLATLLKTLESVSSEFPSQSAWEQQAAVAGRLVGLSAPIPWPANVSQLKPTDSWAIQFALPVVVADRQKASVDGAVDAVNSIVDAVAKVQQESARGLASATHQRLLDAIPPGHSRWSTTAMKQLKLLVVDDGIEFQQDLAAGRGYLYETLSDSQKQLLSLASDVISERPSTANVVLAELQPFLNRRVEASHRSAVQEAYALLEGSLPPQSGRVVRLAVARSWVDQVFADHVRMINAGFQPPEPLDEKLTQALVLCYELQSELQPGIDFGKEIQAVRSRVIGHYRNLGYHQTAAAAIAVKAEPAVDWIDAAAEFELASLNLSVALDDLDRQTRQFQGRENITLTPAVKEAISGFETFITTRPNTPQVSEAVAKVFTVGKQYESYDKFDVAAEVYAGLETFAAANETLKHGQPQTVAERAAFAGALARHVKASRQLKEMSTATNDDPPSELSAAFRDAIDAYEQILVKYSDSTLASAAISKIMEIGLQHAVVGGWDVAETVYAELQSQELPLRKPERLELARALCVMGKVIPTHAKQVLAAITLGERQASSGEKVSADGIASFSAAPTIHGDFFGGGLAEMMDMDMSMGFSAGSLVQNESVAAESIDDLFGDMPMPQAAAPMTGTAGGGGAGGFGGQATPRALREQDLLAAVRQRQSAMANRIAMIRDNEISHVENAPAQQVSEPGQTRNAAQAASVPVLSDAEIARRQTILDVAYTKLQTLRKTHPLTATAGQARDQIIVLVNHWRSIRQWQRSADLMKKFLTDNPSDTELPKFRHDIGRDLLAWASAAAEPNMSKQELLDQVNQRFATARQELSGIIAAFPDLTSLKHSAQWDIAASHLSQARVVARFSPTLARGQFVRAANELLATADLYHDHPNIQQVPQMLSSIAVELTNRAFFDEAITVWNDMTLHYPGNPLAEDAAIQIARTYQNQLRLPLRAVESYLELNFARGGQDAALQDAIFQIASQLMNEKRWVESLHVLETFVDSFPTHGSAGQAMAMIGQVHQTNEVWEDAIAAYRRVILEYDQGNWAQQSKWSIAECTINLSRWEEAQGAYREFQKAYPEDGRVAEATSRLEILKDLARFQKVVDEVGQRKAFDAQYQIGTIVRNQLANPVKAIIEYRKVADRWPDSHLADDALFQIGMIYVELAQSENAREAFLATAERYPTSPIADDALFQVGASFENEALALVGVTRGKAIEIANEVAQKQAYAVSQGNRKEQRLRNLGQIAQLKKEGKRDEAERQTAFQAAINVAFDNANASVVANWAAQQEQALTTAQLADRQDKINAAFRKAVGSFRRASSVASADKADDALLRMAQIYDQRLKDSDAAMSTWLEIVKQYSGTTVAEDASWKIAQYYETHEKYSDAISAYNSFLRNYRRSPKASAAQAAIAENHEQLGNWVEAMDAYTNYINNYPEGTLAGKAKEQIAWIKTYRL